MRLCSHNPLGVTEMPARNKPASPAVANYTLPAEGFVRANNVLKVIPSSRAAFLEDVKAGRFPQPVRLGVRRIAWRVEDIRAYIANPAAFNGL